MLFARAPDAVSRPGTAVAPGVPVEPGPGADRGSAVSRSSALGIEARRALGGLLALIDDPEVQDVLIQGAGGSEPGEAQLWLDRGGALSRVDGWAASVATVRTLATALIAAGGRHLDELHPCADVHLGGGIRVHAVLPPVVVGGAALSIRLPRVGILGFGELVERGLCGPRVAAGLRSSVAARRNLLITGGTATGKTTLLAALLDLASPGERIVTIEDVAELRLAHPHRVALEARQANAEGAGEITLERLLREALRMRPDRIVLGECRGTELVTMLAALNTGHDGGAATLHASTLAGVPARLEALGALAGLEPDALARQAASALHLVVHLERSARGVRRVAAVGRLRLESGRLGVETLS